MPDITVKVHMLDGQEEFVVEDAEDFETALHDKQVTEALKGKCVGNIRIDLFSDA